MRPLWPVPFGLSLALPTEAQWEYACRAGTTTATYAGEMEILGANNAPVLDDIAWYGGNSGVGFDLDVGEDSSGWPEKRYTHEKAGTHPVGLKRANAWGLHDMLGNVFAWCNDESRSYAPSGLPGVGGLTIPAEPEVGQLREPQASGDRVVRGGSWASLARYVRAAYRDQSHPGYHIGDLGFRCARVRA